MGADRRAGLLLLLLLVAGCGTTRAGDIALEQVQVRMAPIGAMTAAVYFTLHNAGTTADTLRGITSDVGSVTLHQSMVQGGSATMTPLDAVAIPAGGTVEFAVGGRHGMLENFTRLVSVNEAIALEFEFARGGRVRVPVRIRAVAGVE
jgi:copper(I)-binding protein